MKRERGQSLVEGTLVLVAFFALIFGVVDCGQAVVAHQSLVERVRVAARWGSLHPGDGTGDQVANWILYGRPEEPKQNVESLLGLQRTNIQVRRQRPSPLAPDDDILIVTVVNYRYRFFSPWLGGAIPTKPIAISVPMANQIVEFRSFALQ